jgi:cell division septum initiation protein DivIVA
MACRNCICRLGALMAFLNKQQREHFELEDLKSKRCIELDNVYEENKRLLKENKELKEQLQQFKDKN